ncbi:MAG: hypothetical protein ACRBB6_04255 [Neptuniibacter sp.]
MRLFLRQLLQILIAFDQLINTVIGLLILPFTHTVHWADETISSVCHRWSVQGYEHPKALVNDIFPWQEDHCKEAYESERNDRHLPPELRNPPKKDMRSSHDNS